MIEIQETESQKRETDKSFFLQWIFPFTLGYIIAMAGSSLAGERIAFPLWKSIMSITGLAPEFGQYDYIFATGLMGAVFGGITSLSQWFVLRKHIKYAVLWIWIGLIGNLLGHVLNSVFPHKFIVNYYVPVIITASILGYFESLVLQKSLLLRGWTAIRVTMNIITLIIANINAANYPALLVDRLVNNSLTGLSIGLVCGVISGLALTWFINSNFQVFQGES